ncbi:carbohydrate-binding protein (plasmid) [Coraliomargarita sp. W4R53]
MTNSRRSMDHGLRRWRRTGLAAVAIIPLVLPLAAAMPAQAAADAITTIEVSPSGDDANLGVDGSAVATLHRAQEIVRGALVDAAEPITVAIEPGNYYLSEPLALSNEDSGTAQAPVTWLGTGDGVKISGGRSLELSWQPSASDPSIMVAPVPEGIDFDELFVNDARQIMARYPNYDESAARLDGSTTLDTLNSRSASWNDPTTGYVRGMHCKDWGSVSFNITGQSDGALDLEYIGDNNRPQDCGTGLPVKPGVVLAENIKEELDSAGEWFLDSSTHELYYMPAAGVDLATAKFETGELEQLVTIEGASAANPVANVTFDNLDFQRTHRTMFGDNVFEGVSRGDWSVVRKGAIFMQNAKNIAVTRSSFIDLGSNGIFMSGYNEDHTITDSTFRYAGATDVQVVGLPDSVRNYSDNYFTTHAIDDLSSGPQSENYPRNILIEGNDMSGNGHYEKQTSSINIGMALDVTVRGNTLSDSPRACLNFSDTTWGGHLIQDNDIFDCVSGSGDNGSINAWGRSRFWKTGARSTSFASLADGVTFMGNTGGELTPVQAREMAKLDTIRPITIDHNRFWHDGDWAIDLDDGSSQFELTNNLILKGGIKLRDGFDRTAQNNLVLNGSIYEQVSYVPNGDVIENNVTLGATPWRNCCQPDYAASEYQIGKNLYWNGGDPVTVVQNGNQALSVDGHTINTATGWYAAGYDQDSVVANPQFANPNNVNEYDFTLAAASPALALGFENFSMSFGAAGADLPPKAVLGAADESSVEPRNLVVEKWMGADLTQIGSQAEQSAYAIADYKGVKLADVPADSEAGEAGLESDDLIRSINGIEVSELRNSFWQVYNALPAGAALTLDIRRGSTDVTLELAKTTEPELLNNTAGVVYTQAAGTLEHWIWRNATSGGNGAYLSDIDATRNPGDSWSLTFNGTGLDIISQKYRDLGDVDIEVDGEPYATVSFHNAARLHQQTVLSITGLAPAEHTVTGTMATGQFMVVDAFLTHASGDQAAPAVSVPANLTIEASDESGAIVTYESSAVDDVDGELVPMCSPESGTVFPIGSTVVTCTATDVANNSAEASFTVTVTPPATADTERPVVVLVSPSSVGPFQELSVQVDAADNEGLNRVVANIYKDGVLVKSTQSAADGAMEFSHQATVSLPDGSYSMKYNASDLAGNISTTSVVSFTIDSTAPTATVKTGDAFTVGDALAGFEKVSFKLFDAGLVDRVKINGVIKDLSNAKWSDVNGVTPGTFGAVLGENTLVVFDVAGNATELTFTLVEPTPAAPAWDAAVTYNTGDEVTFDGATYVAQWWTRNSEPGTSVTGSWMQQGDLVPAAGTDVRAWTASWVYTGGEVVAHNGHVWKAKWWTRNATPGASVWQDLGSY